MFDFKKFKEKVNELNLVTNTISYSDIEIISLDEILIKNVPFKLFDKNVMRGFLKQLGINKTVFDSFYSNLKGDEKRLQFLLNTIKRTLTATGNKTVSVIINEKTLKIVGFKNPKNRSNISNKGMLVLLEETLNNNSSLSLINGSIDNGGNMFITTLDKNDEFSVKGMSDEVFKSGLSFINSPINTIVSPFNERLVCTNGMTTTDSEMIITIKNNRKGMTEFIDRIKNYNSNDFKNRFSSQVELLSNSIASFNELNKVANILKNNLGLSHSEVNNHLGHVDFISEYQRKTSKLPKLFDKVQQKQIKTHIDKWSLINVLTDLSSHTKKYDINVNDSVSLECQVIAGKITMETPDILDVPQIF